MFRLCGHKWLRVLKSSPALPVAASSSRDDLASVDDGQSGDGRVSEDVVDKASPLTFGKVFGAIPKMTKALNTPTINQKISAVFGLPALDNSMEFKKIYSSGREALRCVLSTFASVTYVLLQKNKTRNSVLTLS